MNNNGIQITEDQRNEINKIKILGIDLDNAMYYINNAKDQQEVQFWIKEAKKFVKESPLSK